MVRGWSLGLFWVGCVALASPASADDAGDALAAALSEHRALHLEARQRGSTSGEKSTASARHLDAFEAVLIEERLLTLAMVRAAFAPPVSSGPTAVSALRSEQDMARVARLAASDAPEEQVERELETLVREGEPPPDARALVQGVLFRAVALTAVGLRRQLDELRRSEAFQSAVRERLQALRSALASASEEARAARDHELRGLERELGEASERAGRASFDLDALLRDHEQLFARFARLGRKLHARAKAVLRELEG